jgi:hypothetical protein
MVIQEKVKSLYEDLTKHAKEQMPFGVSWGWYNCFKCHCAFNNLKMTGEDKAANYVKEFPPVFKATIMGESYTMKQVFNLDKTGLFWKCVPSHTSISTEVKTMSGFKAVRDRCTLLLGRD